MQTVPAKLPCNLPRSILPLSIQRTHQKHFHFVTSGQSQYSVKPGVCPARGPGASGEPCLSPCAQDSDCRGTAKCCPLGCGRTCLAPQKGKPGFCPVRNGLYFSYDCDARCQGDGECPGAQKCCLRGCDHECLAPSEGRRWFRLHLGKAGGRLWPPSRAVRRWS
uniref:WAP domain-containing protein n=1 Tax=Chrysemys picta bellii TaxID=8478 RepID=A0A8C3PFQ0_CHRPI